ncbi:hypothetical protein ACI782_09555 [Geodermatophilus sp. SYSU D00703]
MTPPPRLAVHVGRQIPNALAPVLVAATPWCEPVAVAEREPAPPGVLAHLYTSDVLPRRPAAPFAVWQLPGGAPAAAPGALVVGEVGTGVAAGAHLLACLLPPPDRARLLLPFTRECYRRLRGLPGDLVAVDEGTGPAWGAADGTPAPARPEDWPTLAALAGAVVALDEVALWSALAWGAPAVTAPATARRLDLVPGEHVLTGDDPGERRSLAASLAGDSVRAARLGRHGWTAVRDRRPEGVAALLSSRLGLTRRRDLTAPSGLTEALDALDTPRDALVRRRAREATADLPGAVTQGWRPNERNDDVQP